MLSKLALLSALLPLAFACEADEGGPPEATDTISGDAPIEIAAGESFDGGFARYDRGEGACSEQSEGGEDDTVFLLQAGATLSNVIIGANQAEGVYCIGGGCTFENVWFEDVCEDAISIKEDPAGAETNIIGGGAYAASDKIVQHNGCGTVNIRNFYAEDYGKVYRSCGTCDSGCARTVNIEGVTAVDGGEIAGINTNWGDTATLTNICADTEDLCVAYEGCGDDGCEPEKIGACP